MAKRTELDQLLASPETTDISLHGRRAADRSSDDDLVLAGLPEVEKVSLLRQSITRLPPSLDGIERLVSLRTLWLTEVPNVELERTCELLAELPELAEVRFGGALFRRNYTTWHERTDLA